MKLKDFFWRQVFVSFFGLSLEELDWFELFNLEALDLLKFFLGQELLHLDATGRQAVYVRLVDVEKIQNITLFDGCDLAVLQLVNVLN